MNLGKRPQLRGLDGLRALAIAGVTAFHMVPDMLPGGYMGVVLFFVLTGFLLSYTSFNAWRDGRFGMLSYYGKRVRRIYPELLIMLLSSIGVLYWLVPNAVAAVRPEVLSILLGYNNWWQIGQSMDYFTRLLNASPFAHLWFLGVELQYYLLWPVLFAVVVAFWEILGRRWAIGLLFLLAAGTSGLMPWLYQQGGDITRLYYGTDTRICALLWGAGLGLAVAANGPLSSFGGRVPAGSSWGKYLLSAVALVATVVVYCRLDGGNPLVYQGGMLAMTFVFMLLMKLATDDRLLVGAWLDNGVCKWLGQHSYGIFLWQYPVIYLSEQFGYTSEVWHYGLQLLAIFLLTLWGERLAAFLRRPHFFACGSGVQAARVMVLACLSLAGMFFMGSGCYGIAMSADARANIQQELAQRLAHEAEQLDQVQDKPVEEPPAAADPAAESVVKKAVNLNGIACIGDSVMLGAGSELRAALPDCQIDAEVSRYVSGGADVAQAWVAQGKIGDIVVIALGTNGPIAGGERYEVQTKRLLDALGPQRHIFWVNTYAPHLKWQNTNNAYLAELVKAHPNVTIVDWCSAASQHPEWLVEDGVHPNNEGARAFAQLVKATIVQTLEK
ncbi:peptidoglycan-N-acetylmuramate O-acetyltransferase [Selenomonas ruminantium]|uniref:Peptidoglycan-N-acetylmuramate O-acetyltransferase n=1 Tax=Selenomonas ruminantium TaxID=971 RepID=A0A1M6RYB8_SELRU|nr:acyltransferase family protein [Selenomonas ruminantium]SHK37443.1 peptidoglycan-N-acetylmuramate O-acetyltransferase [Selenomonas ruminantium]